MGSEGSGVIIKLGPGVNQDLLNKKLAFINRSWATYTV
jgi:hypothetical protein